MLDREVIAALPLIPPPVLTAYLDTNPSNPRNQGRPSGARQRAKEIAAGFPPQEREKLDSIVIVGSKDIVDFIRKEIPPGTRERVTVLAGQYGQVSASDLEKLLAPAIAKWKRSNEAAHVAEIVANSNPNRAVLGITETLSALQRGDARALIVSRSTRGRLKQCIVCGWTDRAADRVCSVCGGERRSVSLQDALPELARKFSVPVEVVTGKAATDLMKFDGLAAWLHRY